MEVEEVLYRVEDIFIVRSRCVPPSFSSVPPMSEPYEVYLIPDKKKLYILIFLLLVSVVLVALVVVMKI